MPSKARDKIVLVANFQAQSIETKPFESILPCAPINRDVRVKGPILTGNAIAHWKRVGAFKFFKLPQFTGIIEVRTGYDVLFNPRVVVPHFVEILLLALHGRWVFDPTVMMHVGIHPCHSKFLIGSLAKPLGVSVREDSPSISNDPNFMLVPFAAGSNVIV